jgi:hypothetical protein
MTSDFGSDRVVRRLAAGVALNLRYFSVGLGSYPQKTQNQAILGMYLRSEELCGEATSLS